MNEPNTYTTVETGDFVVHSTESPESMQQALAIEPAESAAEPESVETAAKVEEPASDRNADGTFKPKKERDKIATNPVDRMKAATAKEAEAKRERETAQKERDDARAEAAKYRAELEAFKAPKTAPVVAKPVAVESEKEPDPTDTAKYPNGEYDRAFMRDQARFEARQEFRAQQAEQAKQARAQQQEQFRTRVEREHDARVQALKKTVPDYDSRQIVAFNPDHGPMIKTLQDGPQILVWLSDHPDDAQRLASLPLAIAAIEYGRISARLEAASRGTAPVVVPSKAPTPITPLGGGASASGEGESDDESFDAHYARFQKRQRAGAK